MNPKAIRPEEMFGETDRARCVSLAVACVLNSACCLSECFRILGGALARVCPADWSDALFFIRARRLCVRDASRAHSYSGEWVPGVFGAMWEKYNKRDGTGVVWLVCDGPVDALWIENLNTVRAAGDPVWVMH
jgi:hypothetical protein